MIWSIMKGVFMLQLSEIFVAFGLLFLPSYILLDSRSMTLVYDMYFYADLSNDSANIYVVKYAF